MLEVTKSRTPFLTHSREIWLAKTFQGLFCIASAGAAGETFITYPAGGRLALIGVIAITFGLGLCFARTEETSERIDKMSLAIATAIVSILVIGLLALDRYRARHAHR